MNILLAIDGSRISLQAVHGLIRHVQHFRQPPTVHLLYVHAPMPVGLATQALSQTSLDNYYREDGEAALQAARQLLHNAQLQHEPHIHVGPTADVIVSLADELDCELICMGTHGHGALQNAILGSVVTKVLHQTNRPVLLLK